MRRTSPFAAVCGLFLFSAGTYALLQAVLPLLRTVWGLSYGQLMVVEVAYFAVLVISAGLLSRWVQAIPYPRNLGLAASAAAVGSACIGLAAVSGLWVLLLFGCAVLGVGSAGIQVIGNALVTGLEPVRLRASRFTLAQAFSALGMLLALAVTWGVLSLVGDPQRALQALFISLTLIWCLCALGCFRLAGMAAVPSQQTPLGTIWRSRRAWIALTVLAAYVGVEVALAMLVVPVMQLESGEAIAWSVLYWLGLMVGRFLGAGYLRRFGAGRVVALHAIAGVACIALSSIWPALILVTGLCNSVIYPAVYAIAIDQTNDSSQGLAGFLLLSSLGGAVLPLIAGVTIDLAGVGLALLWPLLGYLALVLFGLRGPAPLKN